MLTCFLYIFHPCQSRMKQSHSSNELGDKPVTAEELDKVLQDLAKFRMIETSPKVPPELPEPVVLPTTSSPLPLPVDNLLLLQNVGLRLGDDMPGKL